MPHQAACVLDFWVSSYYFPRSSNLSQSITLGLDYLWSSNLSQSITLGFGRTLEDDLACRTGHPVNNSIVNSDNICFRYLVHGRFDSDKQSPDIFTHIVLVILYDAREFNILRVIKDTYRIVRIICDMSSLIVRIRVILGVEGSHWPDCISLLWVSGYLYTSEKFTVCGITVVCLSLKKKYLDFRNIREICVLDRAPNNFSLFEHPDSYSELRKYIGAGNFEKIYDLDPDSNYFFFRQDPDLYFDLKRLFLPDSLLYRKWTLAESRKKACRQVMRARKLPVTDESFILVPHIGGIHGSTANTRNYPVDKHKGAERITGRKGPRMNRQQGLSSQDKSHMAAWLKVSNDESVYVDPGLVDFDLLMTCKATVLDVLALDTEKKGAWKVPSRSLVDSWRKTRAITRSWGRKCRVTEFVIGRDSEQDFKEFSASFHANFAADELEYPTHVVSFDVEEVKCTMYDEERMSHGERTFTMSTEAHKGDPLPMEWGVDYNDHTKQFPAKIMFGGVDWVHIISFNIYRNKKGLNVVKAPKDIPKAIIDFFRTLPVVVGVSIKGDVEMVEKTLTKISGISVQMQGFFDLGTLAVLAGWQLRIRNLYTLATIVLGMEMNKVVSLGDHWWGANWGLIPEELQIYALSDIKFGALCARVLMAVMHREFFPDPEIVCRLSKCTHREHVNWFTWFISKVLVGTEVDGDAVEVAITVGTRQALMHSIKYRDYMGKLTVEAPDRVKFLCNLVRWPTLTQGGPRYLHSVRL